MYLKLKPRSYELNVDIPNLVIHLAKASKCDIPTTVYVKSNVNVTFKSSSGDRIISNGRAYINSFGSVTLLARPNMNVWYIIYT